MPNHVQNKIKLVAPPLNIKELMMAVERKDMEDGEEGKYYFDFRKVIPYPEGTKLEIVSGSITSPLTGKAYSQQNVIEWVGEIKKACLADGNIDDEKFGEIVSAIRNTILTGHPTWYEWSSANWGTKWNAYDQDNKEDELIFETAWKHPRPIIEKLSLMFPIVRMDVLYADEDYGSNYGAYSIQNGIVIEDNSESIENPQKFACELHGSDYQEYLKDCEE